MTKPSFDPEKQLEEILKLSQDKTRQNPESEGQKPGPKSHKTDFSFNIKPEELEAYLNKYVIGQEDTIEVIATKVCTHFNRMKIESELSEDDRVIGTIKSNILLIGPTGVGKTYIIKLIAKKIGVPFVKADATKFSETGYVGGDVEDLIRDLVHEADGDIAKAEYGIIYLDEIDKIASSGPGHGPDVSRSGVQRNLLKLMEEVDVDLKTPHDLASQVEAAMEAQKTGKVVRKKINTKNILFIVSGAFGGLDEIIKKRENLQTIGFEKNPGLAAKDPANEILKKVKTEDLIKYGFESEFIGRLPVYVVLNNLDEEGLYKILKNKHSSVILGKKLDFQAYGINVKFRDEALRMLAKKAHTEKTGARGLTGVFEKTLIKFEKSLPSSGVKEFTVDRELIENPVSVLRELLTQDGIKGYTADFLAANGIYIEFTPDAIEALKEKSIRENKKIRDICSELFKDYPYGIKLMGHESFVITSEAVTDSKSYIDNLIKTSYQQKK